jgi:hypothetical protein
MCKQVMHAKKIRPQPGNSRGTTFTGTLIGKVEFSMIVIGSDQQ